MTVGTTTGEQRRRSSWSRLVVWSRALVLQVLLAPVHLWRSTVALRAPRCRFHPSCSSYAVQALRGHGPVRGTVLTARRVGRCHPWNPGGLDPVPDVEDRRAWRRPRVSPASSSPTT